MTTLILRKIQSKNLIRRGIRVNPWSSQTIRGVKLVFFSKHKCTLCSLFNYRWVKLQVAGRLVFFHSGRKSGRFVKITVNIQKILFSCDLERLHWMNYMQLIILTSFYIIWCFWMRGCKKGYMCGGSSQWWMERPSLQTAHHLTVWAFWNWKPT